MKRNVRPEAWALWIILTLVMVPYAPQVPVRLQELPYSPVPPVPSYAAAMPGLPQVSWYAPTYHRNVVVRRACRAPFGAVVTVPVSSPCPAGLFPSGVVTIVARPEPWTQTYAALP